MFELPEVAVFGFDGKGRGTKIPVERLDAVSAPDSGYAFIWVHLQRDSAVGREWLTASGLEPVVIEALTADEARPRCTVHGEGVALNLHGVNLNPGAEPDDMVSGRFWVDKGRVIGVWLRPLAAIEDLFDAIARQQAPASPGDLIAKLALRLAERADPIVADLTEQLDDIEDEILADKRELSRTALASLRRSAIDIRRYLVPQRDALNTLEIEDLAWLHKQDRSRLREAADRVTRLGEELDSIRDRAQIVYDEIMDRRADAMNRHMLLLSIVAAIFLPLSLLTGLLGMNVEGIPGAHSPWAFLVVCTILVVVAGVQFVLFRMMGFFR